MEDVKMTTNEMVAALFGIAAGLVESQKNSIVNVRFDGMSLTVDIFNKDSRVHETLSWMNGLKTVKSPVYGIMDQVAFATQVRIIAGICQTKCLVCEKEFIMNPEAVFAFKEDADHICPECQPYAKVCTMCGEWVDTRVTTECPTCIEELNRAYPERMMSEEESPQWMFREPVSDYDRDEDEDDDQDWREKTDEENFFDLYCDGAGVCFSDADPGL